MTGVRSDRICISEFSLYSIGIILTNLKNDRLYRDFIHDTLVESEVARIALSPEGLADLLKSREDHNLGFDDAYQFVAARTNNLRIVSFDGDFDAVPLTCVTPGQALDLVSQQ